MTPGNGGGGGSGPPDKYLGLDTQDYQTVNEFADALSTQYAAGYTVISLAVANPHGPGSTWVILSGYGKS